MPPGAGAQAASRPTGAPPDKKRIPIVPVVLFANTALVLFAIGLVLTLVRGSGTTGGLPQTAEGARRDGESFSPIAPMPPGVCETLEQAVSWATAERLFAAKQYAQALEVYRRLLAPTTSRPADSMVADLLALRQAQCLWHMGRIEDSRRRLHSIHASVSAIVRAVANRMLAVADAREARWLSARTRAYIAVAALGWLDEPSALEADCDVLVAWALSRHALPLCNSNVEVPDLSAQTAEPLAGLSDADVYKLVHQGTAELARAALGAQVRRISKGGFRRYSVLCSQAPLEELLGRFAAEAGIDVRWSGVAPSARRRSVTLMFTEAGEQRLAEVACGMVGLVARFTGREVIVHDPQAGRSLIDSRELICKEAVSMWRRLFLRAPRDARLPDAHFILGAVHDAAGDQPSALAEFRLTVSRYPQSRAGPKALMQSAKVRIGIRDYAGANKDLLSLLDLYPDHPINDQAHLHLGLAAMKAGRLDEAIRSLRKLYYLDLSLSSKTQAALNLGRCLHDKGQCKQAVEWLGTYLKLTEQTQGPELSEACLLLARSSAAVGDIPGAVGAFRNSLAADPARSQKVQTTIELGQLLLRAQDHVGAVGAMRSLEGETLTESQACEVILLKASVLREMGLADKAAGVLRAEASLVSSPQLGASLEVEMARCLAADGRLGDARYRLAAVLPQIAPGPLAWRAARELAEICIKSGDIDQAVALMEEVLKADCPQDVRRSAGMILADAYVRKQDYRSAALAYSAIAPAPEEATGQ